MRVGHLQRVREGLERPGAGERQHRAGRLLAVVVLGVPGDVFAHALLAAASEVHEGGHPREAARDRFLSPLELVAVDLEGKPGEALP